MIEPMNHLKSSSSLCHQSGQKLINRQIREFSSCPFYSLSSSPDNRNHFWCEYTQDQRKEKCLPGIWCTYKVKHRPCGRNSKRAFVFQSWTNQRLNHVLGVSSPQETGPLLQEMVLFKSEEATWIERQHTWRPLAQRKHQNIRGTVRGPWIHSRMSPAPNHQNKRPWTIIRVKMHKCRNSFKHLKGTNTKLMISSFKAAHPSPPKKRAQISHTSLLITYNHKSSLAAVCKVKVQLSVK